MKSLRKVNYKQLLARHKELVDIFAVEIDYNAFNNTFYVSKETSKIAKSRIIDIRYFDSVKIINKDRMVTVDKFTSPHISVKLTESARKEIADKIFGGTLAVVHNAFTGDIKIFLETEEYGEKLYHDLATDKKYTSSQIRKDGYCKRIYRLSPVTASGARNGGLMSIFWTQKVKLFYAALLANNSHCFGVM